MRSGAGSQIWCKRAPRPGCTTVDAYQTHCLLESFQGCFLSQICVKTDRNRFCRSACVQSDNIIRQYLEKACAGLSCPGPRGAVSVRGIFGLQCVVLAQICPLSEKLSFCLLTFFRDFFFFRAACRSDLSERQSFCAPAVWNVRASTRGPLRVLEHRVKRVVFDLSSGRHDRSSISESRRSVVSDLMKISRSLLIFSRSET